MTKKRGILLTGSLALFLGTVFCPFTPALHAQNQNQYASAQQQPAQQKSETFTGQIAQLQNGQYALITGKTPQGKLAGHFLDDQNKAKKFAGKNVKVTGTLDATNNIIHVTDIQLA